MSGKHQLPTIAVWFQSRNAWSTVVRFGVALCIGASFTAGKAFSDPPSDSFVFVSDTNRWVGILRGPALLVGKLDASGDFHQVYRFEGPHSLAPPYTRINAFGVKAKKVYEFRSGRLIKGELLEDGKFIPETDSMVSKLEDYKYSPDAPPIWYLPGYFKKKSDLPPAKPAK